jgi:pilus assembly protein CpaF
VVIGECRGAEALDMLQAMNTGHDGSLTTGHSNNPREMLSRLETMVLMAGMDLPVRAIREQIAGAIHLIIHQDRMKDGQRRVTSITEIVGMEATSLPCRTFSSLNRNISTIQGKIHGSCSRRVCVPSTYDRILESGFKLPIDVFRPKELDGVASGRRALVAAIRHI